jgi:hypothetical protein
VTVILCGVSEREHALADLRHGGWRVLSEWSSTKRPADHADARRRREPTRLRA